MPTRPLTGEGSAKQTRDDDKSVVAHIDHFGIQVMISFDSAPNEAQVVWESLYGVAWRRVFD
jgi:hypothetical protein